MADEYPNSGRMFDNTRKEKPTHPDYDGNGEVTCSQCGCKNSFFINGWKKESGKGPWFSFSFKHKTGASAAKDEPSSQPIRPSATGSLGLKQTRANGPSTRQIADDDIPF